MPIDRIRQALVTNRATRALRTDLASAVGRKPNHTQTPYVLAYKLSARLGAEDAAKLVMGIFADQAERENVRKGAGAVAQEFVMTDAFPQIAAALIPLALDIHTRDGLKAAHLLAAMWEKYPDRRQLFADQIGAIPHERSQGLQLWLMRRMGA